MRISYGENEDGNEIHIYTFSIEKARSYFFNEFNLFSENTVQEEFENTSLYSSLKQKIKPPLYLDIKRKINKIKEDEEFTSNYRFQVKDNSLNESDIINESLSKVQKMVKDNILMTTRKQEELTNNFRNKVLETILDFDVNIQPSDLFDVGNAKEDLEKQQEELIQTLDSLNLANAKEKCELFYTKLITNINSIIVQTKEFLSSSKLPGDINDNNMPSELRNSFSLLSVQIVQLNKYKTVIDHYHKYKEDLDRLKIFTNRFIESVNLFFSDGKKRMSLKRNGDLIFSLSNKKRTIDLFSLSSGEKQLIIMLANLVFLNSLNYSSIFIIDEPELSLHLSWQEIFVESLQKANPDIQFIMATHAPAIVAKREYMEKCIDLTSEI